MKGLKITGKIILYVVAVLMVLLILVRLGVTIMYFDYFSNSESEFMVPGLTTGFVQQGFDYIPESETFLIAGYMKDGDASRIYFRTAEGDTGFAELKNEDGIDSASHAGGVCHNGEFVYVASLNMLDVFRLSDVLDGGDATRIGSVQTGYDMAYCTFHNGYLLAGDFYHPETYETPESHRITTPAGDNNTGLMTIFKGDETAEFGVDPTPVAAISTTGKVQGMCFTDDGDIVLSTSYSVASSYLYRYEVDTKRSSTVEVLDTEVPLFYLDSANLTNTVTLPPMSEELVFLNGRVYVMCESACNKYIFGKFIRGYQVFAYEFQE